MSQVVFSKQMQDGNFLNKFKKSNHMYAKPTHLASNLKNLITNILQTYQSTLNVFNTRFVLKTHVINEVHLSIFTS